MLAARAAADQAAHERAGYVSAMREATARAQGPW